MTMPALFVGHGNPMNAIIDNEFSRTWAELGRALPRPKGIVCVSAHWETDGTCVTAMEHPATIHDFSGFPAALENMHYPAPGSPELAGRVMSTVRSTRIRPDRSWGLDHGTWSV
ncbi:MAG: class III extradiol ring-cleavage dioxygenase, partial [Desulfomicrobium sp.]|nr:class III extradiol ring-cleavage dioxygenase [Desulfomicrobium sp.]